MLVKPARSKDSRVNGMETIGGCKASDEFILMAWELTTHNKHIESRSTFITFGEKAVHSYGIMLDGLQMNVVH